MRTLWYWPHPHRTASRYPLGSLGEADTLTVQALASYRGEQFGPIEEYEVVRDLPDPTRAGSRIMRPLRRLADMATRVRRRRVLLRSGFDCLHIETITYGIDAFDLPRLVRQIPVLAVVHDVEPHVERLPRFVERILRNRVYQSGAALVVFHEALADLLVERYRVPRDRVHVIPFPLNDNAGSAAIDRGDDSAPTILFFGSLRPNKGLSVLVEAFGHLANANAHLVIAGAGHPAEEQAAERFAASNDRVHVELGFVSEARKWELFGEADVVVLPYTTFSSQSAVLGDAYRARVPVVVTDVGALGWTVRHDGTGEVVPSNDPTALATAIDRVLAVPLSRWRPAIDAAMARHDEPAAGRALGAAHRATVEAWHRQRGTTPPN